MDLSGRVAIVTGGAGGIGSQITRQLVHRGASVLIADLLDDDGEKLAAELNASDRRVIYSRTDVTLTGDVESAVESAARAFGPPGMLVNCAGWLRVAMATVADEDDFDRTLASHIKGTWLFSKHVLPHMQEQGRGAIVNISSMQAYGAVPGRVAYEAAKGGISAMTRALALEYGPAGVRVNAVCPGVIITHRNERTQAGQFTPEEVQMRIEAYPLRRFGTPQDVASAVLFLLSDEASWITGTDLFVDGGMSIQLAEAIHFPPFRRLWRETVPQA